MSRHSLQSGWLIGTGFLLLIGLGAFVISQSIPLSCEQHPLMQCPIERPVD